MNRRQVLKHLASLAMVRPLLTCEDSDGDMKDRIVKTDTILIKDNTVTWTLINVNNQPYYIPLHKLS